MERLIYNSYSNENEINVYGEYAIYLRKSRADMEAELKGEGETLARHEHILLDLANSKNLKLIFRVYFINCDLMLHFKA